VKTSSDLVVIIPIIIKMMKWFFGLLFLSSFSFAQDAAMNQLYYLGGAGDPLKNPATIFDTGVKNLIQFCKDSTWIPDVRFNGGHADSEKFLKAEIKAVPDQSNFDANAYKEALEKMKAKAKSLPDGSKMLIYVDSHGADRPDYVKVKTHQIAISSGEVLDATTLVGTDLVDLDGIKDVIALANARHLQIAVIDMSCHSGFTQSLANDQTCVITSTSSDLFGYGDFSDVFTEKMKKGKNLESIFLDTREKVVEGALPQISTAAGQYLSTLEDHSISGFMANKDKDEHADNLTELLKTEAEHCIDCDMPSLRLVDAKAKLKSLSSELSNGESDSEFKKLQNLLEKYQVIQSDIEAQLKAIGYGRLATAENVEVKYTNAFGKPDSMVNHMT